MIVEKILPGLAKHNVMNRRSAKGLAPFVIGCGLLLAGAASAKADSLKKDLFQKENTELTAGFSKKTDEDKKILGEGILGVTLLTYIGFGLYSHLSKKGKENDSAEKQ